MTLLLDTHAFLWFWWADPQLSAIGREETRDPLLTVGHPLAEQKRAAHSARDRVNARLAASPSTNRGIPPKP